MYPQVQLLVSTSQKTKTSTRCRMKLEKMLEAWLGREALEKTSEML